MLENNGGSRIEYKNRTSGDTVFYDSLRSDQRSPLRHFVDPENDKAEITSYLNWPSIKGKAVRSKRIKVQSELTKRLSKRSPAREPAMKIIQLQQSDKQVLPSFKQNFTKISMPMKINIESRNSKMNRTTMAFSPRLKPVTIKAPMDKVRAQSVLK